MLALGQQQSGYHNLIAAESLLETVLRQDPSNRLWQMNLYSLQLKRIDASDDSVDANKVLTELQGLNEKLTALSILEPKRVQLAQLIASVQQGEAEAHRKLGRANLALTILDAALARLEQLRLEDKDKGNPLLRIHIAQLLLMKAELNQAVGSGQAAESACRQAKTMVTDVAGADSDYRLLVLQVRASLCTGQRSQVLIQIAKLEQMTYREVRYLRYLSTLPAKKGNS